MGVCSDKRFAWLQARASVCASNWRIGVVFFKEVAKYLDLHQNYVSCLYRKDRVFEVQRSDVEAIFEFRKKDIEFLITNHCSLRKQLDNVEVLFPE